MSERPDESEVMARMHSWLETACKALGLDPELIDRNSPALLDMVRVVAHGPSRPAAPLSAFLVGYAAGKTGADPKQSAKLLEEAARDWQPEAD